MSDNSIQKNQSAKNAHQKLVIILEEVSKYEHSALLVFSDIMHQKLYEYLGYSSMLNYATEELEFSQSKAYSFIKMAGDLEKLPATKKAVTEGKIELTKARELTRVATPKTEKLWLAEAGNCSQKVLATKVKQARDKAKNRAKQQPELIPIEPLPKAELKVSTSLSFTIEQMERFNVLIEKMRKQGETGSREELLIKALTVSISENSTRVENAHSTQIVIRQCPDCGKAETGAGEISQNDLEKAYCDANVLENGRNRATIRPSVRREVMSRDNHICQGKGCSSKRYLEVHHKIPRAMGGSNKAENLVTLCSACHRLVHKNQTSIPYVYNGHL
jgi:5-methylcytosine-specific restriction endonuclease McrA